MTINMLECNQESRTRQIHDGHRKQLSLIVALVILVSSFLVACDSKTIISTPTSLPALTGSPLPTSTATKAPAPATTVPATATLLPTPDVAFEPEIAFERTYGGDAMDRGVSVFQTEDGGYILSGVTESFGAGNQDAYLVRVSPTGEERWSQAYGGTEDDSGWSVVQTPDGGFIIAGFTSSFGAGGVDIYLIRTDPAGEMLWTKTYGGAGDDYAWAIQPAAEGGYVLAGQTSSLGAGGIDAYLVRIGEDGEELWSQTYGGNQNDRSFSVQQTRDGGFVIAGITFSYGAGARNAYVVKTDEAGNLLWEKTFGGEADDVAHSVDHTEDGGYILIGYTSSFDADNYDAYLIKLDPFGDTQWTKIFGGDSEDRIITGQQTTDGGYILVGYTKSFGAGGWDAYLVKTDAAGNPQWEKTFGGPREDNGYSVQQNADGAYILIGHTQVTGTTSRDVYLIKIDSD